MPHKVRKDGLVVDAVDNRLMAKPIDSFIVAVGEGTQADWVILRLYLTGAATEGAFVPPNQVHQFAVPSAQAEKLGRSLLEWAAQAEKAVRGRWAH